MVDETVTISVDDSDVENVIVKLESALDKKGDVEQTKVDAEEGAKSSSLLLDQGGEIRGTNLLVRRTIAQLPGIREGYHLIMLIRTMMRVSPEIALILGAWMAGSAFVDWLQGGVREAEEYRKMVMEARGLKLRSQFDVWLAEDKRTTNEAYRSAVPT